MQLYSNVGRAPGADPCLLWAKEQSGLVWAVPVFLRPVSPSPCSLRAMLKANFGDFAQNPILPSQHFVGKTHQQHVKREAMDVPSERCPSSLLQQAQHSNIDVSVDRLTAKALRSCQEKGLILMPSGRGTAAAEVTDTQCFLHGCWVWEMNTGRKKGSWIIWKHKPFIKLLGQTRAAPPASPSKHGGRSVEQKVPTLLSSKPH